MKRLALAFSLLLFATLALKAQTVWTLEECINHAFQNNIQLKQSRLGVESAEVALLQSKMNMLPNLNAYASHGYNYGKAIDRFTNEFATERVQSNNFYGSSSVIIFNGLQKFNTVRQNQLSVMASQYDTDSYMDDMALNIATAYLQILFNEELLQIAIDQLEITRQQVQRVEKLVAAGTLARGDLLLIEAQLSIEELQEIEAMNRLDLSYLTLAQMLDLPSAKDFRIAKPDIDLYETRSIHMTPEQIYTTALGKRPSIRSAELRVESANKGLALARSDMSPILNLDLSWGSGFSGLQKIGVNPFYNEEIIGFDINRDPVYTATLGFESFEVKPFWDQISDNNNRTITLALRVPIFNGYAVQSNISRAKIAIENAQYEHQTAKLQLNKAVQQAWADATASLKRYAAANKSVEANEESFTYAEQRYNVGMLTSFEYNNAKNDLQRAQSERLQAKYEYVFKTKVLDFYMGIPITL